MNTTKLHYFRKDYIPKPLLKKDLNSNPFQQFLTWFELAKNANFIEPNAMNLSTVGSNGQPSSRIVLLKSFSENGFVFFTNYESKKGKQIEENPFGAILFYWDQLDKEVRIEGRIIKTSKE
jgi:pyridoxamine 5'-phosphate oxidase